MSISVCTLYPPSPHAFWQLTLWAALLALYVGVMVWQRQLLEWLKARITYPRTVDELLQNNQLRSVYPPTDIILG